MKTLPALVCSVAAAVACGLTPLLPSIAPDVPPPRAGLFLVGAAAFASNLVPAVHPLARGLSLLVQALCVFQMLGFSIGLTITMHGGRPQWNPVDWHAWSIAYGMLIVFAAATVLAAAAARAEPRTPGAARPPG